MLMLDFALRQFYATLMPLHTFAFCFHAIISPRHATIFYCCHTLLLIDADVERGYCRRRDISALLPLIDAFSDAAYAAIFAADARRTPRRLSRAP